MSYSSTPVHGRASTVEIRPGEGGADAALFASELAQAISAWCRRNNTSADIVGGLRS